MKQTFHKIWQTLAVSSCLALVGPAAAQTLTLTNVSPVPAEDRLEGTATATAAADTTPRRDGALNPAPGVSEMRFAGTAHRRLSAKGALATQRMASVSAASATPSKMPFSLPAVASPTLFNGDYGLQFSVPDNVERLEIRLAISTPTAQVAIFVRYGGDVETGPSGVVADYYPNSTSGTDTIVVTRASQPPLSAGPYFVAFGVLTPNMAVQGSVTVVAGPACPELALGAAQEMPISFPQVSGPTLLNGDYGRCFTVPQEAGRLNIQFAAAQPSGQVALFARFNSDVALADGNLQADYASNGAGPTPAITIGSSSTPPLGPGTYYIAFGVLSIDAQVSGTLKLTADKGGPDPCQVNLPAVSRATLVTLGDSCRIDVPAGAKALVIQMTVTPANARVSLYLRSQQNPGLANGRVVADYWGTATDGSAVVIATPQSAKPLAAGSYYIAFAMWTTGVDMAASLTPSFGPVPVQQRCGIALDPVSTPTLFTGDYGCRFEVASDASQLDIRLQATPADAQVVLLLRFGADVDLANGQVIADYVSPATTLTVGRAALRPGTYFLGFGLLTTGRAVSGAATATTSSGSGTGTGTVSQ